MAKNLKEMVQELRKEVSYRLYIKDVSISQRGLRSCLGSGSKFSRIIFLVSSLEIASKTPILVNDISLIALVF